MRTEYTPGKKTGGEVKVTATSALWLIRQSVEERLRVEEQSRRGKMSNAPPAAAPEKETP